LSPSDRPLSIAIKEKFYDPKSDKEKEMKNKTNILGANISSTQKYELSRSRRSQRPSAINSKRIARRRLFALLISLSVIAVVLVGSPPKVVSAAGDHLDLSFGGNGKVATDFIGGDDFGTDIAIQSNGRIVVVGYGSGALLIARYHANGTLDTSFNGTGKVIHSFLLGSLSAVAIQSDGKIVVGGTQHSPPSSFVLARFTVAGAADATFGNNGIVSTAFGGGCNECGGSISDLAIQADGKIIAVGLTINLSVADWGMIRYNTNGSLDTTFGTGGKVTTDFGGNTSEAARAVSILSNGKILVAGRGNPAGEDFALAQYTTNGSLDITFGTGGKVITDFAGGNDGINDLRVQPDGKIVAAGFMTSGGSRNFALARYNANGTLDTTFDTDGRVETSVNTSGDDSANGLALQSDGKIVAVGDNGNVDFSLARYNPNGSLDTNFGQSGILFTDLNNSTDTANAVAMQADGKIVVAGTAQNSSGGTKNFAVVRYLPNPKTAFDFDGDSKADVGIFRPSNGQWWINPSSTGSTYALQFGATTDRIVPADYTGDGRADIAFFRPSTGTWFILRSENNSFFSFPFGLSTDIPAPADFDADGKADPAVFRPSTSTWFIQRSSDNGTTIVQFGANGDVPVAADYDGDGRADIAIYRPSNGQWWINRSTLGVIAMTFGVATDKTVPGDYTGDGKADVAFWRPSTGAWFILRSENGSFYSVPFGISTDIPAPGDYDGDGKFDTAVFRPSQATWYIQRSTAGTQILPFGANGDRPVANAFVR
jgi:uncharacterized delta-60 repeat protein